RGYHERDGRHALGRGRTVLVEGAVHRAEPPRPRGDGEGVRTARPDDEAEGERRSTAIVSVTLSPTRERGVRLSSLACASGSKSDSGLASFRPEPVAWL